jgi:hypothetical protein
MHTQTQPPEFLTAMRSVRAAKNLFLLLVLLGLLIQIGAFIAVQWGRVIDESQAVLAMSDRDEAETRQPPAAEEPDDAPADAPDAQPAGDDAPHVEPAPKAHAPEEDAGSEAAELWFVTLTWVLPGSRFMIVVSMAILTVILMFATMLAINGRASGVAGIVSAALWSVFLLAIVVPWQQALNTSVACGATFSFADLLRGASETLPRWGATTPNLLEQILYYVRFLGFPGLALLVWLVVTVKFARGYGRMLRVALGEETKPDDIPDMDSETTL